MLWMLVCQLWRGNSVRFVCNVSCDSSLYDRSPGAVVVGHTPVGSSARCSPSRWCATGVIPGRVPRSTFRSCNQARDLAPKLWSRTVRDQSFGDTLWFRFWARLVALISCPTLGFRELAGLDQFFFHDARVSTSNAANRVLH